MEHVQSPTKFLKHVALQIYVAQRGEPLPTDVYECQAFHTQSSESSMSIIAQISLERNVRDAWLNGCVFSAFRARLRVLSWVG